MQTTWHKDEVEEIYTHFADISHSEWLQLEDQVLQTTRTWLQPLYQSNCEEEANISTVLGKAGKVQPKSSQSEQKKEIKRRYKEELRVIKQLESDLVASERNLEAMRQQECFWTAKCELERSQPFDMLRFRLLNSLLPYECHLEDQVSISYSHLDSAASQTLVTWDSSSSPTRTDKRDSMCTAESCESTAAVVMTMPTIKRVKNRDQTLFHENHGEGFLPERSVARKLYGIFLDGDHMKRFITEQFKCEHEMGILTMSDVFQRLNLMALDVLELQKYYTCRLEAPSKSKTVILHVAISLGQLCSIGIRFTYDLSNQRSMILPIPINVFVEPITGEPAVPINTLLRVAQQAISTESYTNAFLLKRTCAAIVDTIQGRNSMTM